MEYLVYYYRTARDYGIDERDLYGESKVYMSHARFKRTHSLIVSLEAENLEDVFYRLNHWHPEQKIADYIRNNRLHTSMSVGDIAVQKDKMTAFICCPVGWKRIYWVEE